MVCDLPTAPQNQDVLFLHKITEIVTLTINCF